jgi:hypothetical protein
LRQGLRQHIAVAMAEQDGFKNCGWTDY